MKVLFCKGKAESFNKFSDFCWKNSLFFEKKPQFFRFFIDFDGRK